MRTKCRTKQSQIIAIILPKNRFATKEKEKHIITYLYTYMIKQSVNHLRERSKKKQMEYASKLTNVGMGISDTSIDVSKWVTIATKVPSCRLWEIACLSIYRALHLTSIRNFTAFLERMVSRNVFLHVIWSRKKEMSL